MKTIKKFYVILLLILSVSILTSCDLFSSKKTTENIVSSETDNIDNEEGFDSLYPKGLKYFNVNYRPNMHIS